MDVIGQMYAPSALLLGKESHKVPVELEAALNRTASYLDTCENKKYPPQLQWIPDSSVFQTIT